MLHTGFMRRSRFVRIFTVKDRSRTVVLLLVLNFTALFNPPVHFPPNHIAKTVSTTPTIGHGPTNVRFWSETVAMK